MPIPDANPNLPGLVAQINDTGLKVATPPQALTQSVLLLGVATDGPVNTPIQIASIADAENIFGTTQKATTVAGQAVVQKSLTARVYEAFAAGCTDIRLVRVGGTSASLTLIDSVLPADDLTITANYPGAKYNALTVAVVATGASAGITITTIDGVAHSFPFTAGTTVYADLMNAINASPINVTASQTASGANPLATVNLSALAATSLSGGVDGTALTDAQYSDALTAAYRQLEDYPVDVVVPCGAYLQPSLGLDSTGTPSVVAANGGDTVFFGLNLAQFVARMSVTTKTCIGVISVAPLLVPTFTNGVNRAKQLAGTYNTATGAQITAPTVYTFNYCGDYSPAAGPAAAALNDAITGQPIDTGYLLQICVGPDMIVNTRNLGNVVMDLAPSYAGRVVTLAPQSAATNKPLSNGIALAYQYGPSILNKLVGLKFVAAKLESGTNVIKVVADQTYSAAGKDYTKLSTLRIVYAAMEGVRRGTQGFIGEAANPQTINSMGTAIDSVLKAMKSAGALLDYEYHIVATTQNLIDGDTNVVLGLVPAMQIRKIFVQTSLKPPSAISQ
jgi:hypothetical protein